MSETASWQPSASIPNLLKRAAIMAEIRRFFVRSWSAGGGDALYEPGDGNRYSFGPV